MMPFIVNAGILILLAAGLWIFDASLELGNLQGAVFKLYLLYASIGLFVINAVIAVIARIRGYPARAGRVFVSGLIAALIGAAVAYVVPM